MLWGTSDTPLGRMIAKWYSTYRGTQPFSAPYSSLGWLDDLGALKGAAIFTGYTGPNIDIHLLIDKHPSIKMRNDIYKYVFDFLECQRLTGIVPATHTRLKRLVEGLGFHLEGVLQYYYGPLDKALIYGLYATDVRKVRYGHVAKHSRDTNHYPATG